MWWVAEEASSDAASYVHPQADRCAAQGITVVGSHSKRTRAETILTCIRTDSDRKYPISTWHKHDSESDQVKATDNEVMAVYIVAAWNAAQQSPSSHEPTKATESAQAASSVPLTLRSMPSLVDRTSSLAPLELIKPHILRLWAARLTDQEIIAELQKEINLDEYGIG